MMSTPPVLGIIAATVPPEGVSYQWNTLSLFDVEQPTYMEFMKLQGWRFVPPERHPDLPSEDGKIVYQGSVLMERDAADTAEALVEDADRAAVDLARAEQNRSGNKPHDFQLGDEVWDRRTAVKVGIVVFIGTAGFEILPEGTYSPKQVGWALDHLEDPRGLVMGESIGSGASGRANPHLNWPKQEDMVKTRAEAMAYIDQVARQAARAEAERIAFNTDGDADEIERELLSWMDGGYMPPPKEQS